jgi:hypothetical protein
MRTLLRAPRYTASSNRRTKSGSLCFHSSVNPGFRVLKTFSLRSKKPSSVIQFASSNAASRTVQFKTSPKPRCQDHDRFRPPRARANDVHVLNQLFPLRNIFITLPSPPFVLIGARAVRFRAVSTLISPICVHLVQPTTSKDSKKHPPLTRTSPKLSPRFASSLSLSLKECPRALRFPSPLTSRATDARPSSAFEFTGELTDDAPRHTAGTDARGRFRESTEGDTARSREVRKKQSRERGGPTWFF